jgi:hypothetical protein
MGEIKSTLDLVMEKTRHMTMSREERDAQIAEENRKKISGLIQKYVDGRLNKESFLDAFGRLNKIEGQSNQLLLLREGLVRIELAGTPDAVLELLAFGCRVDVEPLAQVLSGYAEQKHSLEVDRSAELRQQLAAEHNVSGSAVVPDLQVDSVFTLMLSELESTWAQRLEKEKARLAGLIEA